MKIRLGQLCSILLRTIFAKLVVHRSSVPSPVPAPNHWRNERVYTSSGNVPADGAKLPTILDHSMEEAETKEERLENLLGPGWS